MYIGNEKVNCYNYKFKCVFFKSFSKSLIKNVLELLYFLKITNLKNLLFQVEE